MKYSHIFWDWNGTLLDDINHCVNVINSMLIKRGLKPFGSADEYHKVFSFPVIDYYRKIGFNFEKEPFEDLAVEYIDQYYADKTGGCKLHKNAEQILLKIHEKGIKQVILSASELNNLKTQLADFCIEDYFDSILGISDIYAGSKTEIGLKFMRENAVEKALLIGDTEHDFETARALNADCVLIANGHQSREKLLSLNVPVLENLTQVLEML